MSGRVDRDTDDKAGRRRAELVTRSVSALLLALLVGGLIVLELQRGDARARITVTPHYDRAYEHDGQAYVPVTVANDGDRTTGTLRVDLSRPVEGEQPEVAEFEFTFLAGGELDEGTAVFDEAPDPETLEISVVSVTEP